MNVDSSKHWVSGLDLLSLSAFSVRDCTAAAAATSSASSARPCKGTNTAKRKELHAGLQEHHASDIGPRPQHPTGPCRAEHDLVYT
jgi:hypothetical protein